MSIELTPVSPSSTNYTTRQGIAAYLSDQFGPLVTSVGTGQTFADGVGGVKTIIDSVWRQIGVDESELSTGTIETTDIPAALALANYFQLKKISTDAAGSVNISVPSMSVSKGQVSSNLEKLLAQAREEAQSYGYLVGVSITNGYWDLGTMTTYEDEITA